MKSNQKGFSVVEILIIVVILGLVGTVGWLVYDRQKNNSDDKAATQTSTTQKDNTEEVKVADPYEGWKTYTDSKLNYSFKYPVAWTVTPVNYGDKLEAIQIDSSDIKTVELPIGATDVIKGSRVTMYTQSSGDYTAFTGLQKQLKDNSTINPVDLTLGAHKAIEYAFAYEGPENTYIRVALNDSQYILTVFTSEGKESAHPNYDLYKKILASIK